MNNLIETVHSPLTTHHSLRKVAFTLAEVLITIGIIGVVAALTLPTIIQNYQKQVTINKLKKAYSVLGQIAQNYTINNEKEGISILDKYDYTSGKKFFETYWLSQFKSAQVFPEWKVYDLNNGQNRYMYLNKTLMVSSIVTGYIVGYVFFQAGNGETFFINMQGTRSDKEGNSEKYILKNQPVYIDINGLKQPNTLGKDVFLIYVNFEKGTVSPYGYETPSYNTINESCKAYGTYCSAKIIQDGWKIKSDYPWNKT